MQICVIFSHRMVRTSNPDSHVLKFSFISDTRKFVFPIFGTRIGESRTCIDLRRERFPVEGFSAFNIAGGFQP